MVEIKYKILLVLKAVIISEIVAFLFYDSVFGIIPGAMIAFYSFYNDIKRYRRKNIKNHRLQFKDMMIALDSALAAGYSLENAFKVIREDLGVMYQKNSKIMQELEVIDKKMEMNIPIEIILNDFGRRMKISAAVDFAEVIATAKKTGGNIIKIIRETVAEIANNIETDNEIEVMIAAKSLEQRIMTCMPFAMIFYLRITNKGYLSKIYFNLGGIIFVTIGLIIIMIADYWGKKIVEAVSTEI